MCLPHRHLGLALLYIAGFVACSRSTADLTIPGRQTFLLGEYADYDYRVGLDNRGSRDVTVRLRDKRTKLTDREVDLPAGGSERLSVAPDQEVTIENEDGGRATVFVKMSRSVRGMRYTEIDGSELRQSFDPSGATVADPTAAVVELTPRLLDDGEAEPRRRTTATLRPGQRLIVGEGTTGGYEVQIRTHGANIEVSGRDRATLQQRQGFGLRGRETVYVRRNEILYLDAPTQSAKVTVRTSVPVRGARVTAID